MMDLVFVKFVVWQKGKDDDGDEPLAVYCAPLGCLNSGTLLCISCWLFVHSDTIQVSGTCLCTTRRVHSIYFLLFSWRLGSVMLLE